MAKNKQTFTIDANLDISQFLTNYKKMIETMKKQGGDQNALASMEKTFDNLAKRANTLEAASKQTFSNSKEIEHYQQKVEGLKKDILTAGTAMQTFASNSANFDSKELENAQKELQKIVKQIEEVKKTQQSQVASGLNDLGFKNFKDLAKQIDSQEELNKALEKEYDIRSQNKHNLEKERNAKLASINQRYADKDVLKTSDFKPGTEDKSDKAQVLNSDIQAMISLGANSQQIMEKLEDDYEDVLGDLKLQVQLEERLNTLLQERDALVESTRTDYDNRINAVEDAQFRLGNKSSGHFEASTEAQRAFRGIDFAGDEATIQNLQSQAATQRISINELTQAQQNLGEQLKRNSETIEENNNALENSVDAYSDVVDKTHETTERQEELNNSFDNMKDTVKTLLSVGTAISTIKDVIMKTYEDVKELDKSFAEIAMVTDYSVQEMWNSYGQYAEMANELGQSTQSVIQASGLFYQQGLQTNEALELTEDTMKLATLAGLDFEKATSQMTAALRGFHMEMDQGNVVTDVYSELAAKAAADVEGIAYAMSKTASIASSAGMEFQTTSAFLTQMIETTQEAPENIGTAMKTIIARFTELKENVAGTAESQFEDLTYNKVDEALQSVGVSIKDAAGQFRDLDDVFLELSGKWDTLDRNSQRYIATIAAGSRQQSRFIAMMENYDRTMELVETAYDSAGKSSEQFAKYQDTIEYKITQLKNTWEQMRTTFFNSEMFKGAIDGLNALLKKVQDFSAIDIVSLAAVWVTFGRLMITNIIKGIQSSATLLATGLTNVVNKASNSVKGFLNTRFNFSLGIKTNKLKEDIKDAEQKIKDADRRIEENSIVIDVDTQKALEKLDKLEQEYESIRQDLMNMGFSEDAATQYADSVFSPEEHQEMEDGRHTRDIIERRNEERAQAEQDRENAQNILDTATGDQEALENQAAARGEFIGQTLATGITMAMTAVVTSNNPMEAFGQVMLTGLASMIPSLISMVTAAGGSMSAAFIASTAGIGALILGIVAIITAAIVGVKNLFDDVEASKFENRFKAAKKAADEAKQAAEEAASAAKESRESFESAEELKERFTELNEKQALTTEEQEEYNELVKQIQDEFPQVISYYNEATGELRTQNDLWEEIVDKQKIAAEYAAKDNFLAANASVAADTNLKRYEMAEDYSTKSGLSQVGIEDYLEAGLSAEEYVQEIKDNLSNSMSYSDVYNNVDIDKLANLYGINLDEYEHEDDVVEGYEGIRAVQDAIEKDDERVIEALEGAKKSNEDLIDKEYEMIASNFGDVLTAMDPEMGEGEKKLREEIAQTAIESDELTAMTVEDYKRAVENTNTGGFERGDNFFDAMHGAKSGPSDNSFGDLSELIDEGTEFDDGGVLAKYGIADTTKAAELFIRSYESEADAYEQWEEWQEGEAGQMKIFERIINQALAEKMESVNKLMELNDAQTEQLEKFYKDAMEEGTTQDELTALENYLEGLDGIDQNVINNFMEDLQKSYDEASEKIKKVGLSEQQTKDWSTDQMNQYVSYIESASKVAGEKAANNFGQEMFKEFEGLGLETDQLLTAFSSVDWSTVTLGNLDETRKQFVAMMEKSMGESFDEEKVDQLWKKFFAAADKYNVVDLSVSTEGGLDAITNSLSDTWATNVKEFSGISKIITEQLKDGFISFSSSQDVTEALTNMGLKADDYLNYQDSGGIEFKTEELMTDLLESQDMTAEALLKKAREETEEKLQQLQAQKALLLAGKGEISNATALIDAHNLDLTLLDQMARIMDDMGQIDYSGMSIDTKGISDQVKEINQATTRTELESVEEQIELLTKFLDEELVEGSETWNKLTAQEQSYRNELIKTYKESAEKAVEEKKKEEKATEDLTNAKEKLIKAQKEYNEALHGTEKWLDEKDPFAALSESASLLEKKLESLKKKMEDITTPSEGEDILSAMTQNRSSQLENLTAQQRVAQDQLNQLQDFYKNSDYSKYFAEMPDGTTAFDISKWFNEGGSDEMGDWLLDMASKGTEAQEKILDTQQKINDIYDEQEKEHEERVKNYATLQEKIIDVLKENAKEEIDTQKEKYEALKEADDDYLDALKDAIDKQRRLRDQESQYQDLATKEKKLSLMQRDTSGANQKEVQELEKEIEEERQNLLDSKVDEILDDLGKTYELQAEMRDLEIEQKEIALEEKNYLAELASVESSFHNQEDVVAWMIENDKEWENYTIEQQEQKIIEWEELGTNWAAYLAEKETGYSDLLIANEENIKAYAQTASDAVADSIERIKTNEELAQKEREEAAEKAKNEAKKDYQEALDKYNAFTQSIVDATPDKNGNKKDTNTNNNKNNIQQLYDDYMKSPNATFKGFIKSQGDFEEFQKIPGMTTEKWFKDKYGIDISKKNEKKGTSTTFSSKQVVGPKRPQDAGFMAQEVAKNKDKQRNFPNKGDPFLNYADAFSEATNQQTIYRVNYVFPKTGEKKTAYFKDQDDADWAIKQVKEKYGEYAKDFHMKKEAFDEYSETWMGTDENWNILGKRFAQGGLVNYTGPAWVDGTPNRPEAFLSAEDTERIGEAAKLLAQLPIFSSPSSETPISSNVGDTSIEIHINVENLSSDYDVDQMIERVKKDIVDVSKPIGSSVILNK